MQLSTAQNNKQLQAAAVLERRRRRSERKTVFGIVSPEHGLLRAITKKKGFWVEVDDDPDIYIAEKMERVLKSNKRFIVVKGGRGSSKSVGIVDISLADCKDTGSKTYCLREFQSSIRNSVYSLIKEEINRFGFQGFDVLNTSIARNGESVFEFAGIARNIESVKSTHGFKRFAVEEAQFMSQDSIDALTPTIREKPKNGLPVRFQSEVLQDIYEHPDLEKVSIIFVANPMSSADPFSQRFIEPFKDKMVDGVYEDDMHLIVDINYMDNPWFEDSGLEIERAWDKENRSRAYYYHRWHGEYNDSVEDAIIKAEWFDAAIDAHKIERLERVFTPRGARIAAHDPSDEGDDAKGYALRHGSIVLKVKQKDTGEIDDGCDWATGMAIQDDADWFVWDGDGMGAGLKRQVATAFAGKKIKYHMFRGSLSGKGQDNAEKIYQPQYGDSETKAKTYAETFKNNRAQFYTDLATRFYNTYRCVVKKEYVDPEEMISLDSDGIDNLPNLRSEVCRIPKKDNPNGLIQIMNKKEMKLLQIDSPNESDSIMMSLFKPKVAPVFEPIDYPDMSIV